MPQSQMSNTPCNAMIDVINVPGHDRLQVIAEHMRGLVGSYLVIATALA
jgi:hypothetical protein